MSSDARDSVLIFAGAGASYAVDKQKYPTTVGFLDRFPEELQSDRLLAFLAQHFEGKFGDPTPDVEKTLWCLEELLDYFEKVRDPTSPVSWVLPENRLGKLLRVNGDVTAYQSVAHHGIGVITTLRDRINEQLYAVYKHTPDKDALASNWSKLIPALLGKGYWLDLVTTNYDLVLESVADESDGEIGYGQIRRAVPRLDLSKWQKSLVDGVRPYKDGLITKLHGSLNWERDNDDIAFAIPSFKSDHKHHVCIYPGFKGIPQANPFSLFHNYFERALLNAKEVIFVGFAFRDEYINTLLSRSQKKNKFVAIDPSDLSSVPNSLRSRIHHIRRGFDERAVAEAIKYLDLPP